MAQAFTAAKRIGYGGKRYVYELIRFEVDVAGAAVIDVTFEEPFDQTPSLDNAANNTERNVLPIWPRNIGGTGALSLVTRSGLRITYTDGGGGEGTAVEMILFVHEPT